MIKSERQEAILTILRTRGHVAAQALAKELFTSYSSIRRDLEALECAGLITRSYGRAELAGSGAFPVSYPIRINKNAEQKRIIAKKAVALIRPGDTVFIDPSSSCSFFAREIMQIKGVTVVTNNVEVVSMLSQSCLTVLCSGGVQSTPNRYALVGPIAERTFREIHADWAVFSAFALTADGRIYDVNYHETATRRVMLQNAEKALFLCDSSKLGAIAAFYQCDLSDIDCMVCDSRDGKAYGAAYPALKIL